MSAVQRNPPLIVFGSHWVNTERETSWVQLRSVANVNLWVLNAQCKFFGVLLFFFFFGSDLAGKELIFLLWCQFFFLPSNTSSVFFNFVSSVSSRQHSKLSVPLLLRRTASAGNGCESYWHSVKGVVFNSRSFETDDASLLQNQSVIHKVAKLAHDLSLSTWMTSSLSLLNNKLKDKCLGGLTEHIHLVCCQFTLDRNIRQ